MSDYTDEEDGRPETPRINRIRDNIVITAQLQFKKARNAGQGMGVSDEVRVELADAVAAYHTILHEHRNEAVIDEDWADVDEIYRTLQASESEFEVEKKGRGRGEKTVTRQGLQAAPADQLFRLTLLMDDLSKALGASDSVVSEDDPEPVIAGAV